MPNVIIQRNTAPAADHVTVFARLGRFAPASALSKIKDISARMEPLERERNRWLRPCAEAEIHRRREAVKNDPSEANLAAVSLESADQLAKRYEATADEYHRLLAEMRPALHQPYTDVLAGLLEALDGAVAKVSAENTKQAEGWGVKYDAAADPVVLSLLRLRESAVARLDNPNCVMHPEEFRQFLGIKRGLFS